MNKFKWRLAKDTFLYSRKRKTTTKSIFIVIIAIALSTIVSALIATAFGYNPFETIKVLFSAAFEIEPDKFAYMVAVFALAAFAFSFAFKAGIFNIGISGQMYGAGVTLLVITTAIDKAGANFPPFIGQLFAIFIAMLVGACIALITGFLEQYLKVNAVVSAIILNWIILLIGFFVISAWYSNNPDNYAQMTASTNIPSQFTLAGGDIAGWIPAIIIVVLIAIILLVISKYTVFGHKINATGLAKEASRYAGYNVNLIKLSTFAISGALSGILAVVLYTARTTNIPATILNVVVPTEGFSGIAVGLIANNNPIGIILVSIVIGLYKTSSSFLSMSPTFNDVIIGFVMLGAAITVVFYQYKPWIFILKLKYSSEIVKPYNDFENKLDSLISKYKSIYMVFLNDQEVDKMYKLPINRRLRMQYKKVLTYSQRKVLAIIYLKQQISYMELKDLYDDNLDVKLQYLIEHGFIQFVKRNNQYLYQVNKYSLNYEKIIDYSRQYNFVEDILSAYIKEVNLIKNEYAINSIKELMQLKLNPEKYIDIVKNKIIWNYDNDLTKYVSKQKAKIERNLEIIHKGNKENKFDHFLNSFLEKSNENHHNKIKHAIKQNDSWKQNAITKKTASLSVKYNPIGLNEISVDNINCYQSNDANLDKINQKITKLINHKVLFDNDRQMLLKLLVTYNQNLYLKGGKLC